MMKIEESKETQKKEKLIDNSKIIESSKAKEKDGERK